jgi:hypothetical protein
VEEPVFQYVPEKCLSPAWGEVRILSQLLWIRNDFDADPDSGFNFQGIPDPAKSKSYKYRVYTVHSWTLTAAGP